MAGTGIYGELLKAQLENLASDPASTSVGRLYWNTSTQSARIYTSSGWDDLGGGGSGASGRNYLADWFDGDRDPGSVTSGITATGNITISTTSWQASNSTGVLTVARTSSSPLRQTYSLLLDHLATGAAFVQTPCFLLDAVDLGKPVTVSFDVANVVTSDDYQVYAVRYTSGGTYQEQIPIAGTASATSPYSARIPTGTTKFQGFFIAGSTSTDYYVIRFYRNSASDTTDIKVDSLYVGPEKVVQGFGGTDPIYWTPTGSWSSNTTYTGKCRYVGSFAEFELLITLSGAPTSAALTVNLPVTIDTAAMAAGTDTGNVSLGIANVVDASPAANYQGAVFYNSTTSVGIVVENSASTYGTVSTSVTQAVPITFASGDKIFARFSVPVVGRSSNITMADRAVEEYAYNTSTADSSDTTSFGYGASGVQFGSYSTATRTKRVRFQTPIQPTDLIVLEVKDGASAQWVPFNGNRYASLSATTGMGYYVVNSTDVDVCFGSAGYAATAYSVAGAWSGVAGSENYKWRVRKVSGGAAVGYPIGARNIVGDVSGTTVPSGYIGQIVTSSVTTAQNVGTSAQYFDMTSITLTPGTWLITGNAIYIRNSATLSGVELDIGFIAVSGNSQTGLAPCVNHSYELGHSTSFTYTQINLPTIVLRYDGTAATMQNGGTLTPTNGVFYLKGYVGTYSAATPQYTCGVTAVRIA